MDAFRVSSNPSYEMLPTSLQSSPPLESRNSPDFDRELENLNVVQKIGSLLFGFGVMIILLFGIFAIIDFGMTNSANYMNNQIILKHGINFDSMIIYNLQPSSNSTITAGCNVTFKVTNKRDVEYFYDKGMIWVFFDEKVLWTLPTREFYQAVSEKTLLNVLAAPGKMETDIYVPRALVSSHKLNRSEMFKIRFDIYYRGGVGHNGFNLGGLKYFCDVNMTFRDQKTLVSGPHKCVGRFQDFSACSSLFF
ncbi:putative FAD-dependent urate hydroxylase-like [Capsicum annuum]|nr:putative FAD-dependent urate hydroxylase-like [Capsicum annuum]KAF3662918.1 putative FAD-dependent urate hydroxylase-like [Capsicum annuum]